MLSFFVYENIVLFVLRHQYMRTLRKKPRNIGDSENVRKLQNVNISSNYETGISSIILDNVAPKLCFYHFLCKSNWNPVKIRPVYRHNNWICNLYCYFKYKQKRFKHLSSAKFDWSYPHRQSWVTGPTVAKAYWFAKLRLHYLWASLTNNYSYYTSITG